MDSTRFTRRGALLLFAVAAALLVSSLPSIAGAPASKRAPSGVVSRTLGTSPARIESYWTPKRMRAAKPAPIPVSKPDLAATATPQVPSGSPAVVPPVEPRSLPAPVTVEAPAVARRAAGPFPYSRYEITTPAAAPYSTVGKVFFSLGPSDYVCSGTAVASENKSAVMTAGHCVVDGGPGLWSNNWAFAPGYRNGNTPFGLWTAQSLWSTPEWVTLGNLRYDVGAAILAPNSSGQYLTDVVGGRGIAFNLPITQTFRSFGYPAGAPFDGSKLFVCDSNFGEEDVLVPGTGPNPIGIGCDMTGGSSGGGWIIQDALVNSVNSYKVVGQNEVMYGPYFGSAAEALYNSVRGTASSPSPSPSSPSPSPSPTAPPGSEEPTTHSMNVTLALKKRLVAKGRMTADDGYRPCTRNAPIRVQRRAAGRWKTVKTVTTNDFGRYRAEIQDRPGRYRVFSPRGIVDELNLCSSAKSGAARHR
jgi:V8-like Glu-specific endopeptidase